VRVIEAADDAGGGAPACAVVGGVNGFAATSCVVPDGHAEGPWFCGGVRDVRFVRWRFVRCRALHRARRVGGWLPRGFFTDATAGLIIAVLQDAGNGCAARRGISAMLSSAYARQYHQPASGGLPPLCAVAIALHASRKRTHFSKPKTLKKKEQIKWAGYDPIRQGYGERSGQYPSRIPTCWTLTTLRNKQIKIGCKVVRHARLGCSWPAVQLGNPGS